MKAKSKGHKNSFFKRARKVSSEENIKKVKKKKK